MKHDTPKALDTPAQGQRRSRATLGDHANVHLTLRVRNGHHAEHDGYNARNAHSLIEMLVVLIIVAILIAIVVPAVQRSRESARMAQCIHQQGQLAKAVHMHVADEPYGRFPGYRAFAADGTTTIGWAPQVLEYLGKSSQPASSTQATYVEVLVCPSDQGPKDSPRLNYVVNGGQAGIDSAADGIFFDHAKLLGERVFITKDDFVDGLTNTIMLAENLDATEWTVTDEANQCILWPLTTGNEINAGEGSRPSSHHPGGFVAAFADGSVKLMSEADINDDANIGTPDSYYVALLTPGGNDSTGSGGGYVPGESSDAPPSECAVCVAACAVPNNPLAHYKFDNPGNVLAEANGGSALIFSGGADYDAGGKLNGAASFSGELNGSGLDVPNVYKLSTAQGGSVAAWVKTTGSLANGAQHVYYANFVTTGAGNGSDGFEAPDEMNLTTGPPDVNTYEGGYGHVIGFLGDTGNGGVDPSLKRIDSCNIGIHNDQWHHVVMTWDPAGDFVIYYDGCEEAHKPMLAEMIRATPVIARIGRPNNWGGTARWFTGLMDDLRLYSRSLSPCEVMALYEAGN